MSRGPTRQIRGMVSFSLIARGAAPALGPSWSALGLVLGRGSVAASVRDDVGSIDFAKKNGSRLDSFFLFFFFCFSFYGNAERAHPYGPHHFSRNGCNVNQTP
jgi:hypothetical protein